MDRREPERTGVAMRASHRPALALGLAMALAVPGCQGVSAPRAPRSVASIEPGLDSGSGPPTTVVEAPAPKQVTVVDRHPLFYKPREYYENSGNNKVVKAAAATVIGIPAGIVGEVRQIVSGQPAQPNPY
jgi:hypothetical protein